ncbi:MAG: hypothetical protein K0S76_1356 [Herbinix sp.]|nr:hypothetical protein [Herbinix sp.]
MVCPNCGSNISDKRKRCERCGTDLDIYKKTQMASNQFYNSGLAKAKVRDLSGAIVALRNSLELNKMNINARNLLGLIYFEMGETVAALSEWVISKHFQPDENDADEYINKVQSNPTKLDNLNQAIKRYNTALNYAKQGSDDLAIIQLKRVTTLNPHFIRAYQLLSLLLMKNGESEKAKKCLIKAGKIDVSNTTTLRYMREMDTPASQTGDTEGNTGEKPGVSTSIMPISSYKEDKPNIMAFVNLVIGVIIGIALMAILVVPSLTKKQKSDDNTDYVDYSAGLALQEEKDNQIKSLEEDKKNLQQQVDQLQTEIDGYVIPEDKSKLYDPLFDTAQKYILELTKAVKDRDLKPIADALTLIDENIYESEASVALLNQLKGEIYPIVSDQYYDTGRDFYSDDKFAEAQVEFEKAMNFDVTNVDAIYYRGRAYHHMDDYENAKLYYSIVITDFPDSDRRENAQEYLEQIQE